MSQAGLRYLAFANHAIVWVSSLIVTGILSYFLNKYSSAHNTHIIYQEVIAVITLAFWTLGMILPLISRYCGHLWPINLALSYLWLTSFIFSAQDWSRGYCLRFAVGFSKCGLKKTVIAFNFLAFFFLLCNAILESWIWHEYRNERDTTPNSNGRKRPDTASSARADTPAQNTV
ncbi:hypothetical protein G3M48_003039 [Beauveria asiatica]|uniref:MARVEL domain-containing protein n=1 Tax=Beauveria asiatica TaxID=1069075 RepID=A0AAW0RX90_9HYPO